jgi:hypothetical protein
MTWTGVLKSGAQAAIVLLDPAALKHAMPKRRSKSWADCSAWSTATTG